MAEQFNDKRNEESIISSIFLDRINENIAALQKDKELIDIFTNAVKLIRSCISNGGKILLCGNGGSSSAASHIVNDFVGHMYIDRQPMRAISLVDNISVLTALSNDYGYDTIFSRQVDALGDEGDLLIGLSTSGNSDNVILAAETAKNKGMFVIAMTNQDGGKLAKIADVSLRANTMDAVCAEHMNLIQLHILCEAVEAVQFGDQAAWKKRKK